jgi:hypothetical protein
MRRVTGWLFRQGGRAVMGIALRRGGQQAINTALESAVDAVPNSVQRSHTQIFNVKPPVTVYVRASHCRVFVRCAAAPKVVLEANLYRAFGVELATEQDDAGVYVVARRKPVVGTVSRTEFTITVPPESHLAFHLTPGDVIFENVEGTLQLSTNQIFTPALSHTP